MSTEKKVFTKEERQAIVEEFSRRHNGQYSPELFLKEVKDTGESHPAYSWFEWDGKKAAQEYRLWQARSFAKDLRIKFDVEEIGRSGEVTVKTTEMPMVMSPRNTRNDGGGYLLVDPNDPAHKAEHCHQAAAALRSWLKRYGSALIFAGYGVKSVEQIAEGLEAIQAPAPAEAAE